MTTDLSSSTTPSSTAVPSMSTILSFSQGSDEPLKPSPCTAPCEVAAYHAMGIGPNPELCDKDDTPFINSYENCAACIENLDQSADDVLKPEVQQALKYCDIEVSFTAESSPSDPPTLSAEATSEDDSDPTSTSSPTQTSDNSDSDSSNNGGDDDSSGSLLSTVGPFLGSIASLVHFIFI